jgi:electron transfer flavoprotein beta subunit
MNIVILVKLVPDLVEELTVDASGAALDMSWLRLIINEFDDHAIEQGILLKERGGGQVTVVAPDGEGVDDVLFTAAAKGADRLIKVKGEFSAGVNNHALARSLAAIVKGLQPDLVLTGVQANNDIDGALGPLLAGLLEMPYVGYISGTAIEGTKTKVRKEYPGGLIAEMEVALPAVLGIQAAEQPPRYVAVSKVRQMMKTSKVEEQEAPALDASGGPTVTRMFQPEAAGRATMLSGTAEEVSAKLIGIFKELGVL